MKPRSLVLAAALLVCAPALAALRVDGKVVQPTPDQLVGATMVATVAVSRITQSQPELLTRAELSGTVSAAPVAAVAWPADLELYREVAVKVPVGEVQRLQPDGLTAAQPLLQSHPVRLGVSLATRFAVSQGQFQGQVRGQVLSQAGTQPVSFAGHDYPVPSLRRVEFEHDLVLGTNRFTVDGHLIEVEVQPMPGTLRKAR